MQNCNMGGLTPDRAREGYFDDRTGKLAESKRTITPVCEGQAVIVVPGELERISLARVLTPHFPSIRHCEDLDSARSQRGIRQAWQGVSQRSSDVGVVERAVRLEPVEVAGLFSCTCKTDGWVLGGCRHE